MIFNQLDDLATVDSMNIDSFVYGVLSDQTADLPTFQATTFADTLAILMNSGGLTALDRDTFKDQLISLILRLEQGDDEDRVNVVDQLRRMFQGILSIDSEQPQAPNT